MVSLGPRERKKKEISEGGRERENEEHTVSGSKRAAGQRRGLEAAAVGVRRRPKWRGPEGGIGWVQSGTRRS